jgi:HEAT repeat protein/cyclophilin family peptidyl-prolyl cis-trans isomerase
VKIDRDERRPSMIRSTIALVLALTVSACRTAPPPPPIIVPVPPALSFEQKAAAILKLENQRVLRNQAPPADQPAPAAAAPGQNAPTVAPPLPPPDLVRLLSDNEARVRRRAALAVGRVGLRDGVQPLVAVLADADPEVRQMAAFALGLLGDKTAHDPLVRALADESPLVQGSAAEALGLVGDPAAAEPIGRMVAQIVQGGVVGQPAEDEDARRDTAASAFRLGVYALVRLKAYDQLAAAVLDASGQPRIRWWPVAFALQRLEDKRALSALLTLAQDPQPYTRAFAVKGLGLLTDRTALPVLLPLLTTGDRAVLIETIRALGRIGDGAAAAPLLKIVASADAEPHVRLEAVTALGGLRAVPAVNDTLLDLLSDPKPAIRAAALGSTAAQDPEEFVTVLSGIDPDPNWTVRAALASVLGTLTPEIGLPRLTTMLNDSDQRVFPAVLASLVKLRSPNAAAVVLDRLKAEDPVVRVAAANGMGELKPANGAQALAEAYRFGQRDATYVARAAAIAALTRYGADAATPVLKEALTDKDWAVRVRAAALLKQLDPSIDADAQIRPAPLQLPADAYEAPRLTNPTVSTQVYIDTDRGTIQIELAVLDAPLTVENFTALARKGFFDGLPVHRVVPDFVVQGGDPRGDGEGGPGYAIRDELSERPFLRGAVGMALDWADTGGSQFFITHSPQPHLDAKYTVFGRVIAGMDIVDKIEQWDVIRRVRIWDGAQPAQGSR